MYIILRLIVQDEEEEEEEQMNVNDSVLVFCDKSKRARIILAAASPIQISLYYLFIINNPWENYLL